MLDLLPGFEPSESDLIQMALDMPLEKKIEKALLFFRTYCDGAYGAFSGGKDSCVIKELAIEAGVTVRWHYNNTTIDPPELVAFIRKHHAEVKWNNPKIGLLTRMVEKANCPTRRGRWCCEEYKEQGGSGENRVIGVRIAESPRRKHLWKTIVRHRKDKTLILCPICYWTDEDVWQYIRMRRLPYCCLYDEGKKRLGCVGCPLAGEEQMRSDFRRWPRFERAWRKAFHRLWARWHGVPNRQGKPRFFEKFTDADAFFEWWIRNGHYDNEQCVFEEMMEQR